MNPDARFLQAKNDPFGSNIFIWPTTYFLANLIKLNPETSKRDGNFCKPQFGDVWQFGIIISYKPIQSNTGV